MKKTWTPDEIEFLSSNWSKVSLEEIISALDRTEDSVLRKARRIGIDIRKKEEDKLIKNWTKEEDKYVLDNYGAILPKDMLEFLPDRTTNSIKKRAQTLGVANSLKRWTKEEEEYLEEKWGTISLESIAKNLGRTTLSVHLKAYNSLNLKEPIKANGAYLTPTDICEMVGVPIRTIYSWVGDGKLPTKRLNIGKSKKYQILPDALCEFLKNNQNRWDSRQADVVTLKSYSSTYLINKHEILTIRNTQWLEDKITRDIKEGFKPFARPWTTKETEELIELKNKNMSYLDIASVLNRDISSIKSKYYLLNKSNQT